MARYVEGSDCAAVAALLRSYAAFELDLDGERQVRDHLAGCPGCREALRAADPSFLFDELAAEPVPPATWDGFQETLMARLPEGKPGAGLTGLFRAPKLAYLAPLLAVLLVGVSVLVTRPGGVLGPRDRSGAIRSPYARPGTPVRPGRAVTAPGGVAPLPWAAPGSQTAPLLEEAGSPGARVYRFTVGAHGDEAPIYLVVDDAINL